MKYYHLSKDLNIVDRFIPRIPDKKVMMDGEDSVSPRICLADSIDGCLTAVPWGNSSFEKMFINGDCSKPIRVYEFDSRKIQKGNLVSSKSLYRSDRVRDAEVTGEVWVVNQELKPVRSYLIRVESYDESSADIINYSALSNFDEENDMYEDILDGVITVIENAEYSVMPERSYEPNISFSFHAKSESNSSEDMIYAVIEDVFREYWDCNFCFDVISNGDNSFQVLGSVDVSSNPIFHEDFLSIIEDELSYKHIEVKASPFHKKAV